MPTIDFSKLVPDEDYFHDLGNGLWLMDDHRWALIVWDRIAVDHDKPYALIHADWHWDGGYDMHESPEMETRLLRADRDSLFDLVSEGRWIRFDSFIAPAIVRGLVSEVHFICKQADEYDVGIDEDLLQRCNAKQWFHDSPESLSVAGATTRPLIFDLCLDLFNRSDQYFDGDIWPDAEILGFLETVKRLIVEAHVVTISVSFGYSGTETDTRHLAELVIPCLQSWRSEVSANSQ